ncbi:MAG TPA: transketolase C-terminal domain-containing protein, partial [Fervidobacterium nodosum]|nr:transketolase C-terminal domain-containing protein [Fervidobacterium nodosum]
LTVFTTKGKGYHYSEANPTKYHGVEKFDPDTGYFEKPENSYSYSEVFGKTLVKIAEEDDKVVALTAAMPDGTGLTPFSKEFPDRFVDLGITEQSVVTYAGGLSTIGYKPVVAIYSTFLQRAYDQIIHDIALQNLNVLFAIDRAGLVGTDGPTHHGVFDICYLKSIPNMKILTPIDAKDLANMLYIVIKQRNKYNGPIAIRYPRDVEFGNLDEIYGKIEYESPFKWKYINIGKDIALLSVGTLTKEYIEMCKEKNWTLVGVRSVKPLDEESLKEIISNHSFIFTIEEGMINGGFGESVLSYINENLSDEITNVKIKNIGIKDEFITHGTRYELIKLVGLDSESIKKYVEKYVEKFDLKGVKRL